MKLAAILLALGFVGCAHVEKIGMKDNKDLYDAKCRGSVADCHKMASETCKGGYDVVDSSQWLVEYHTIFVCK